jgi:predicted PurR-regulated permease PerM
MAEITVGGGRDFDKGKSAREQQAVRFHRTFLLIVLLLTGLLFVWIVNYFLVAILVAGSLTTLFNPLNLWIRRRLRGRAGLRHC